MVLIKLSATNLTYSRIRHAVNKAFHNESKRLWQTGDRVRILEGAFKDALCFIHEIDEANQIATVEFGSPMPTRVEVSIEDLERHFVVGDQVRVALGKNKGRTGSILVVTDDVGTIIEGTANQVTQVIPPSILHHLLFIYFTQFDVFLFYLETCILNPSFSTTPHPLAASSTLSKPEPPCGSEAPIYHQTLGGRDPRIGRDAAVYVGHMKGYQGRLIDINRNSGKIECPGRQFSTYTAPLSYLVLM